MNRPYHTGDHRGDPRCPGCCGRSVGPARQGLPARQGTRNILPSGTWRGGTPAKTCHKENPPKAKTSHVACMGCHGDAKKMAERTKNSNPNPHAYAPEMVCTKCHYGHK